MSIAQTATMTTIDPITLEVLWNRLLSVCSEQQAALMRTAFSTIVRESQDLACGVFDIRGNMVAQSETGTPGHINAMATGVRHFLKVYPPESLSPGDVLLTNDPWMTAGQINDITILTPVFRNEKCVALFANTCHVADIGGRILSAEAREVYEEGLYLPIMKLFDKGERNEILFQIIRGNVRLPDEVEGDLYAMTTCNDVGGARLLELMDEFDLDTIEPLSDAIIERSEQALRAAIRELPDGVYENELWSDGFEAPIVLKAKVIVDGDSMTVDHTGSSPQSRFGINSVLNYTHAYTSFAVKAAICPEVPHNEGAFRPVHVTAPEGTILNPKYPAPVAARHIIGHFLPNLLFGALVDIDPGPDHGRGRGPALGDGLPGRGAVGQDVQPDDLPVRRHRRPPDEGRPEQHRVPERRGRRPGRGDREPDGDDAGAARDQAGLGRPGPVPRRLRPVHDVPHHQRPAVVDGRHARPDEVPGEGVPGREGRRDRRVLPLERRAPEPEGVPDDRAGRLGDAGAAGRRRLLRPAHPRSGGRARRT